MIAAIAMSALSLGAVLELALAAAIRSRAERRRSSVTDSMPDTVTDSMAAGS